MSSLHISLFGSVQVSHSDPALRTGKLTNTLQGLLAFLLLERQRLHSREALASRFWSGYDLPHARNCLNTALWRLRQVLEPDGIESGTYLLRNHRGDIGFNRESQHWLDVQVFEEQITGALRLPPGEARASQVNELQSAVALYTGDLLEGIYDDWALREREYLRRLYLNGLAYLMQYYKLHQIYDKSLSCGQLILDHDPLREEIHREMMRVYAESGQRSLALRQYESCRATLEVELNIGPMDETQLLYQQLQSDLPTSSAQPPARDQLAELLPAVALVHQAEQSLAAAQRDLQEALQWIETLVQKRP